ncbi:MAG: SMC family ATPase [Candidatus Aenigmatarchaeota archaeon]
MITKVRLKNWRSHLDSEFRFSRGTNALFGGMGSGKTSVLNAICFALFGNFPDLQSKKVKLDEIIMNKPVEKNRAEVEVFFEVDGKIYSVKRIIEKGKRTAYSELREEGRLLEAPDSRRVTETVEKILKVDYDLFTRAIYSEQNALDYFLTIPKGQRMKKIDELLMINKFEEARANTKTLTNRLLDRKNEKQKMIESIDLENLKKSISEIKSSLIQISSEKKELKKSFEEVLSKKKSLEEEVKELGELEKLLENLRREEKGINSAVDETIKNLKSLEEILKGRSKEEVEKEIEKIKIKLKELEESLREKRSYYEKIGNSLSEAKAKISLLKKEMEKLGAELENKLKVKEELDKLGFSLEELEEKIRNKKSLNEKYLEEAKEFESKLKDLEESVEKLSLAGGKCPVCDSVLTQEKKDLLVKERERKIEELRKKLEEAIKNKTANEKELEEIEKIKRKVEKMLEEIKDLEEKKKEYDSFLTDSINLSKEIEENEKVYSKLKVEIEETEKSVKHLREILQELEIIRYRFEDYEGRKERLNELMKEAKRLEAKISELEEKISGRNLEEKEKELREVFVKEKELEEKILGLEKLEKEKEERLKEYENEFNFVVKEIDEIKKLEKIINDLKVFELSLKFTQEEMRREFVEAVNYEMNKLWSTLYPYRDYIEIKLNIEEGDYVLQLKDRTGRFINADGIASGGERSVACLALRIAFARVLAPQLRWLVLDEPTHNLDSKAVEDLALTLKTRVGELVDQIFLISHEERLEDAVTGYLYRLERDKGKDEPTKVIAVS